MSPLEQSCTLWYDLNRCCKLVDVAYGWCYPGMLSDDSWLWSVLACLSRHCSAFVLGAVYMMLG